MIEISEVPGKLYRDHPNGLPSQIIPGFEVLEDANCIGWFRFRSDAELFVRAKELAGVAESLKSHPAELDMLANADVKPDVVIGE